MPVSFRDGIVRRGAVECQLRGAQLIYHSKHTGAALVTCHEVEKPADGGPLRLGTGNPLSRQHAEMMAREILGSGVTRTVLPEQVLMWDGLRMAWWTPSRRRRIWFDRRLASVQDVSRQEVTHPAMLWVAERGKLAVWALDTAARPDGATPIFQAPYLSVTGTGAVCAGTVSWPELGVNQLAAWETAFLDSEGAFVLTPDLTRFPGGHKRLWQAMAPPDAVFPADSLVPTGLTVLDALNAEIGPSALPSVRERCIGEGGAE